MRIRLRSAVSIRIKIDMRVHVKFCNVFTSIHLELKHDLIWITSYIAPSYDARMRMRDMNILYVSSVALLVPVA